MNRLWEQRVAPHLLNKHKTPLQTHSNCNRILPNFSLIKKKLKWLQTCAMSLTCCSRQAGCRWSSIAPVVDCWATILINFHCFDCAIDYSLLDSASVSVAAIDESARGTPQCESPVIVWSALSQYPIKSNQLCFTKISFYSENIRGANNHPERTLKTDDENGNVCSNQARLRARSQRTNRIQ